MNGHRLQISVWLKSRSGFLKKNLMLFQLEYVVQAPLHNLTLGTYLMTNI